MDITTTNHITKKSNDINYHICWPQIQIQILLEKTKTKYYWLAGVAIVFYCTERITGQQLNTPQKQKKQQNDGTQIIVQAIATVC